MNINLKSNQLLFLHKGSITKDMIELVVESLEQSVTNLEKDKKVRRKITNVFIEVFQNIGYHGIKVPEFSSSDMMIVISMPKSYKIGSTNLIRKDQKEVIQAKINEINAMSQEELRDQYKHALSSNEMSDKGTAGLGFIDIARKSGQQLYCEFEDANDEYTYFYFETKILKGSAEADRTERNKSESAVSEEPS